MNAPEPGVPESRVIETGAQESLVPEFRMDALDRTANEAFPGYLVRKDLVRRYARQYPVPTYVVEFLLGRYCASVDQDEIDEGSCDRQEAARGPHRTDRRPGDIQVTRPRAGLRAPHRHHPCSLGCQERLLPCRAPEPWPPRHPHCHQPRHRERANTR